MVLGDPAKPLGIPEVWNLPRSNAEFVAWLETLS
jgi:hypothetical protein